MSLYDRFALDERYEIGEHTFTAKEIIAFASRFDPQRFHLDPDLAKKTLFGGHCASGWHTTAAYMKLNVAWRARMVEECRGSRNGASVFGPSPGIRNIRWTRPVFAGETISYAHTVREKRPSRSRPGWGIVGFAVEARNEDAVSVMTFDGAVFLSMKGE